MADVVPHPRAVAGVQAMDDQHGILVESLNALSQKLTVGCSGAKLSSQITLLIEFTGMHFGCEESLLRRLGYPGLDEHRRAHQNLMGLIKTAAYRAELGDDAELERLLRSARGQYLEHVEKFDKEYTQWLRSRGIQ